MKSQADWDLERCFEMFDEALMSKDERVVNALRSLLMIVALTSPESNDQGIESRRGPLRQLVSDHNDLIHRMTSMDNELQQIKNSLRLQRSGGGDLNRHNWPYYDGGGGGYDLTQYDPTAKSLGPSGVTSFDIKLEQSMDDAKVAMLSKLYPEFKNDNQT